MCACLEGALCFDFACEEIDGALEIDCRRG